MLGTLFHWRLLSNWKELTTTTKQLDPKCTIPRKRNLKSKRGKNTEILILTFAAQDVWKFHFATPRWKEGTEECVTGFVCDCYGDAVVRHNHRCCTMLLRTQVKRILWTLALRNTQSYKYKSKFHCSTQYGTNLWTNRRPICMATPIASTVVAAML